MEYAFVPVVFLSCEISFVFFQWNSNDLFMEYAFVLSFSLDVNSNTHFRFN